MDDTSRRAFLSRLLAGSGTAFAWNLLPSLAAAHQHAAAQRDAAHPTFAFFTLEESKQMEAVCEQLIPSDDGPGAREAGAIYFIDYALSQTEPHLQPIFREGLKNLAAASGSQKFQDLSPERQTALLKQIETTEFFQYAREYTILGFLGNPGRHGNKNEVGWKYIGFENPGMFSPPFGYYDAELLSEKKPRR
jgi:gluconate 2-dehydrogenase gamma chain